MGPVFRFVKGCPVICFSSDEVRKLRESTVCRLEVVDISSIDGMYVAGLMDPDIVDVIKTAKRSITIALLRYE